MAPRQLPEARTEREASHIQVLVESRWGRSGCAALEHCHTCLTVCIAEQIAFMLALSSF
jgi:hypothetical protein